MDNNLANQAASLVESALPYWLKGEEVQNFGDYLTELFIARLFYGVGLPAKVTHVIGSVMDDDWLARQADTDLSLTGARTNRTIFWGCGLRSEASLSEGAKQRCIILSVRGPLSKAALGLSDEVPIGDPALLLPSLHLPKSDAAFAGRKVLIPHFLDRRTDAALLSLSGCEMVLRPAISKSVSAVEEFVNQLTSASFVLTGALHGAIVAAAYGTPFAFWGSGQVDIPFKWRDFAASVEIPCEFQSTLEAGERHYNAEIQSALQIPALLPMLSVAPFPVRQDALTSVIENDIGRHGTEVLSRRHGIEVQDALAAETWAVPPRLITALLYESRVQEMNAEMDRLKAASTEQQHAAQVQITQLHAKISELDAQVFDALLLCDMALARQTALAVSSGSERVAKAVNARVPQPVSRQPSKRRSRLRSISEGAKAIGYILLPYNKRRRTKRKVLMAGLRGA